ncbi:UNKNOWN [Stylonychia lemnae]|uniref:Accessory gland protein n=1 Tax=Stylonychia lemnae TaxID=5949 RepID=A0A078BFC9_STYLE|nr:UNKNOWN [Stylonychia lemnae]|eukprot:CDW91852.1 UNKNOWN [Stylonychia lemnae]
MRQPKKPKLANIKPRETRCENASRRFKDFDQFGQVVQLTFKGEETFKTTLGSIISMMIILIIVSFGFFKGQNLINRVNMDVTKINLMRDMSNGFHFKPWELGFDFAFGLNHNIDPSIAYFTVRQINLEFRGQYDQDGSKIKVEKFREISFDKCSTKYFNYQNVTEIVYNGITDLYCITEKDYQFKGDIYSNDFDYLEIKLWKCQNNTINSTIYSQNGQLKCQDKQLIDQILEKEKFNFAYVNTFFDFTDFSKYDAIKYFIDDSSFVEIEANRIKKQNLFLQLQEATMEDDYIQFGQQKKKQFHQIVNQKSYDDGYSDDQGYVIALYIRLDSSYSIYRRKVYSVLELLGDLGGLYRSLYMIGILFVGSIAHKLFLCDVMNKIYQVRKHRDEEQEPAQNKQFKGIAQNQNTKTNSTRDKPGSQNNYPQTKSSNGLLGALQQIENKPIMHQPLDRVRQSKQVMNPLGILKIAENIVDGEVDSGTRSQLHHDQINIDVGFSSQKPSMISKAILGRIGNCFNIKKNETEFSKKFKDMREIDKNDVHSLLQSFTSRRRFSYNPYQILRFVMKCLCWRSLRQKKLNNVYKEHYLFKKGKEKLEMELDVIQLVKTLRKFRLLSQAILNQPHRMLLRFQRQNLIETTSESSDSDDNHLDTFKLMESENPLIRLVTYGKLKKMMASFEGKKLKQTESNLIRGVFKRKLKDFQDEIKEQNEKKTLFERLKGVDSSNLDSSKSKIIQPLDKDDMKQNDNVSLKDSNFMIDDEQSTQQFKRRYGRLAKNNL